MHFWIDKRAASYQYGRRRPNFYSSGTFASAAFGRERNSIGSLRHQSQSSSAGSSQNRLGSFSEDVPVRLSPRHYYCPSPNPPVRNESRRDYTPMNQRRASSYPVIPDPSVQEALDELQQELQATLASTPSRASRSCVTTKHVGLSLCFLGFILLCTVAGKFIVEGPGVLDASRRSHNSQVQTNPDHRTAVSFFFISEVIFVAVAMGLFLTGVACLRKRTNEYLLRQFRQHIINSHHAEVDVGNSSSRSSGTTLVSVSDDEVGLPGDVPNLSIYSEVPRGSRIRTHRYILEGAGGHVGVPGRSRRCYNYNYNCQQLLQSKQKPPPYDVALYLPLPNQNPPYHTNTPPAHTIHSMSQESNKEEEISDGDLEGGVQNGDIGGETPPPAYELQFSYEI